MLRAFLSIVLTLGGVASVVSAAFLVALPLGLLVLGMALLAAEAVLL